jgi:hypothetical protein
MPVVEMERPTGMITPFFGFSAFMLSPTMSAGNDAAMLLRRKVNKSIIHAINGYQSITI